MRATASPTNRNSMLLFCPECQSAFTGVARCPRCGGLLLMPDEAPSIADEPGHEPSAVVPSTPGSRVFVGTIVALGLYLGLRKLVAAWVQSTTDDGQNWWPSEEALIAVFVLQVFASSFGA